jgi:hypothetical protein
VYSYAFVVNIKALRGATSFRLAEGHELRRATAVEVGEIKETVKYLWWGMDSRINEVWECRSPSAMYPQAPLPEEDWRYFVVAFQGSAGTYKTLSIAFDLAPAELEIAFVISHLRKAQHAEATAIDRQRNTGMMVDHGRLVQLLSRAPHDSEFFVEIDAAQASEVANIYGLLLRHDSKLLDLTAPIAQLRALKALPNKSGLVLLGYFAVLESVLTHPPRPTDPYDSITRQIIKKLTLLHHRLPHPIDYSAFGNAPPETIWKKMYAYRSAVAHGGAPDFAREFSLLANHEQALGLVRETTKGVITQAMREPQLVIDLREC